MAKSHSTGMSNTGLKVLIHGTLNGLILLPHLLKISSPEVSILDLSKEHISIEVRIIHLKRDRTGTVVVCVCQQRTSAGRLDAEVKQGVTHLA